MEMSGPRDPTEEWLVVFGATGTTGGYVVRQALEAGLSVRAAVRSPEKLSADLANHERLDVVKADVTDAAAVANAIVGATMVFAALGYSGRPERPVLLPFAQTVVRAMREHGVRRFVYQASAFNREPGHPNPPHIRLLLRPAIGWALGIEPIWSEHDAVIRFLTEEARDLDWMVTRPGQLSDGESKGRLAVGDAAGGTVMYRDLAAFSLDAARTGAYARTCPYLTYRI